MTSIALNAALRLSGMPPTIEQLVPTLQPQAETRTPDTPAPIQPTPPRTTGFAAQLADKENLRSLGQNLWNIAQKLGSDASPNAVLAELANTPMDIHPQSSYAAQTGRSVTLETFIRDFMQLPLPSSHFHLVGLRDAVIGRSKEHPLGNLGGALSWSMPLDADGQQRLRNITLNHEHASGHKPLVMQTQGDVLEFLSFQQPQILRNDDPGKKLEALLKTPQAQLMSKDLQEKMQGIETESSAMDYLLAGITLQLDPESITALHRNKVAGFDLASQAHWGKPASTVVEGLANWLSEKDKTSPNMAKTAAYLLLASRAPVFLIKDIPASVTYGSAAWVSLAVAAAAIEGQTPGKVPNMTFAEVMLAAEDAALQDLAITEQAQKAALLDWGVVNNIISAKGDDNYSAEDFETVRTAYNQQLNERLESSNQLALDMPSRKEIALAELKKRFGENLPFEEKLLKVKDTKQPFYQPLYNPNLPATGMHSLLDIAMSGLHDYQWETADPRLLDTLKDKSLKFDVHNLFTTQLAEALAGRKKAIGVVIKQLIAQQPPADRLNLEYGKLEFFQNNTYQLGLGFSGRTLDEKNQKLLVKATTENSETVYEIDLAKGSITAVPGSVLTEERERKANRVYPIEQFTPKNVSAGTFDQSQNTGQPMPATYSSDRTQAIADAFVEHLAVDSDDVIQQAKGTTTYDTQLENQWKATDFFLNFLPLRSAIVNFSKGEYWDGAMDLGMDLLGFLTAGAATATRVASGSTKAISGLSKVVRATRIIGAGVISAFNPLGGMDDIVKGIGKGGKFLVAKGTKGIQKLRSNGSYDLLKLASKNHGVVATGTFQAAGKNVEGAAVLKNGQWYAFDSDKMQPYGSPLQHFVPAVAAMDGEIRAITDSRLGKLLGSWLAPPADNPNFLNDFNAAIANARTRDKAGYARGMSTGKPDNIYGYSSALDVNGVKRLAVAERRTAEELGSLMARIDDLETVPQRFSTAREIAEIMDLDAFNRGYASGKPEGISGFSESLTSYQLAELAIAPGRTPEQVGQLIKFMEARRIKISLNNFQVFSQEITAAGGKVTALPQGFYLSQSALLSGGQCAAISHAMAGAISKGKKQTFINNMYAAMVPPLSQTELAALSKTDPARALHEKRRAIRVKEFRENLRELQSELERKFHLGYTPRQITHTQIISELASAPQSKTFLINGPDHGITAGVEITTDVRGNLVKEWFYVDPNFGEARFTTESEMRAGLESTLNSGRSHGLFNTYGQNSSGPEYKVSEFFMADLDQATHYLKHKVDDLFNIVV
jgi:hypothetical protein